MNSCSLLAHSICLKCSEMSLLKIRTDLSLLIPPVEPSVSGAEMDPGENPCPSHPLGLLASPAARPASVSGSLPRRAGSGPLPTAPQFHFAFVLLHRWLSPSCKHFLCTVWLIPIWCSSHLDLGTTFPGSAPILPYRCIWVKGPSCLLQIAPPIK